MTEDVFQLTSGLGFGFAYSKLFCMFHGEFRHYDVSTYELGSCRRFWDP
jgi:hypothetical protein